MKKAKPLPHRNRRKSARHRAKLKAKHRARAQARELGRARGRTARGARPRAAAMPRAVPLPLEARSGAARAGAFTTPHGGFATPAFMPVGTHGAVKALTPDQVRATGAEIVLANTYHLALRPGRGARREARRAARVHALGRPDPHRQRRLPGVLAAEARRSATAACASRARSTAPSSSSRPSARSRSRTRSAPTSSWRSTSARRIPPTRRSRAPACAARSRGSSAACGAHARPPRPGAVRDRAGQHVSRTCARAARRRWSALDLPGLRDRRRLGRRGPRAARARSPSRPRRCCPRTSPAT